MFRSHFWMGSHIPLPIHHPAWSGEQDPSSRFSIRNRRSSGAALGSVIKMGIPQLQGSHANALLTGPWIHSSHSFFPPGRFLNGVCYACIFHAALKFLLKTNIIGIIHNTPALDHRPTCIWLLHFWLPWPLGPWPALDSSCTMTSTCDWSVRGVLLSCSRSCRYHTSRPTNAADRAGIDHVVLAFVNSSEPGSWKPFVPIETMRSEYPNAKLMAAIGGWGDTQGFGATCKSKANMAKFAKDVKNLVDQYGLDGVGECCIVSTPCSQTKLCRL